MSEDLRVVVVGSGPSGFYAAEALLKDKAAAVQVDMIDRLPTPFGLARGGVAPDHQKIKNVVKVYERTAADERFRFFGNVMLGRDLDVEDLKRHYDAIVYAVGCESDRNLGIPGEELEGSYAATEFVGWYNGHPDHRDKKFNLDCERVAVVGIGNVAIDVTRVLVKNRDELGKTDIAAHALEALRNSGVKEVVMLGRRGPLQSAFSPKEVVELDELTDSDLVIREDEAALDSVSQKAWDAGVDANAKKNVEFLQEVAKRGEGSKEKKIRLRFCASPAELIGENGKLKAVKVEKNELQENDGRIRPRGTGKFETIEIGMILRSVGYFGVKIPGVPFHEKWGIIPNEGGRVLAEADGPVSPGQYVVGWSKRGPSGLIGTNRACSSDTVQVLLEDFKGGKLPKCAERAPEAAHKLFEQKQPKLVRFEDWKILDKIEVEKGQANGKIREKFTRVDEMIKALDDAKAAA
jgi:ferredoxin--NADP+ reductase